MRLFIILWLLLLLAACAEETARSDAYGNFEAVSLTVSAETPGRLLYLRAEEGQWLDADVPVALVDTSQLYLQRKQLEASIGTLPARLRSTLADIAVLENQRANVQRERDRTQRLVAKQAATPQRLEELNGQLAVLEKQMAAIRANTRTSNRAILAEKEPLAAQLPLIDLQIARSTVYNPRPGTVLTKLSEEGEYVVPGAPLYRLGQLDTLTLRFYVSAVQLDQLRIGSPVQVLTDRDETGFRTTTGSVTRIADRAEFTPKTVQTKEDRVSLVYAVQARVPNPDGLLKIGMPAEVNFASRKADANAAL